MDLQIKGKKALVQGGSSGLGFAIAQALKSEGVEVVIASRPGDRLEAAAKKLGCSAISCDLSKSGESDRLVQAVIQNLGGLDILVINGGGPPKAFFESVTTTQWRDGFESLWMSAVDSIQAALPSMKANQFGRILLVTSAAAREPMSGLTISNGLRAGLLGLAKSLSAEVAPFNVTVNALLPGFTDTERLKELNIPVEKMTASIPAGRLGKPEEFGALATFLASVPAAYITGQAIACDGGWIKGY